ncbi:unnamed protein product [Symbiodinium microadriaticum]|nr:unnamed protein product [Symbiodinium microadriaticum]
MFIEKNPYAEQDIPHHIVPKERHGNQFFGFSVAIGASHGHVKVVVGAYGHRGKGAAFVYNRRADGSLTDEKILYGSDSVFEDKMGWSVDIYNDIVVAGAPMDNNQGSAYVFAEGSDGSYTQIDKLSQTVIEDDNTNPLYGDYFGMTVVAGKDIIAVASPHNDVRASDAGSVYVYKRVSSDDDQGRDTYTFSQALFAPDAKANYRFGWSMDYDPINERLAIGVDFSRLTSYTGQVYLFASSTTSFYSWEATVYPVTNVNDDYDEVGGANFGFAVSIYGDYLAIGSEFGHGEADMTGDAYFFRAQTKKQYEMHKLGLSTEESTDIATSAFGSIGLALLVVVPICGLMVLFMWYRYKSDGENEGFGTYVADELADAWDRMTSGKGGSGSAAGGALGFMEDDDSQHSSHPMMDSAGDTSSDGGGSREKKSRSKLSGLKSSSAGKGASYSKSSRAGMGSSSSKRAAGYTSANVDDI